MDWGAGAGWIACGHWKADQPDDAGGAGWFGGAPPEGPPAQPAPASRAPRDRAAGRAAAACRRFSFRLAARAGSAPPAGRKPFPRTTPRPGRPAASARRSGSIPGSARPAAVRRRRRPIRCSWRARTLFQTARRRRRAAPGAGPGRWRRLPDAARRPPARRSAPYPRSACIAAPRRRARARRGRARRTGDGSGAASCAGVQSSRRSSLSQALAPSVNGPRMRRACGPARRAPRSSSRRRGRAGR